MLGLAQRAAILRLLVACPFPAGPFVVVTTEHSNQKEKAEMTYLLQIYTSNQMADYEALSEEEQNAITAEYMAIAQTPGMLGGHQLQGPETATTVRVQDGSTLTTDGPFAETKEVIGGYYLFEADDLDAAIELASRIPAARMGGAIEVRPVVER
jgi:hypothetical protein